MSLPERTTFRQRTIPTCASIASREDWSGDRSARAVAASGGRAVGVRGGPRRHRRAAARPRVASYVERPDRRGPPGRRPRVRGPGGLDLDAGRGPRRGRRRPGRGRGPGLGAPVVARADAADLTPPGLRPAALAGVRRGRVGPPARRRVAVAAPGPRPGAGRHLGPCAPGRRGGPRRPRHRRSVSRRTTGSWRGRPNGWCGSRAGSTSARCWCPRQGTSRCGRRTSRTCGGTATADRAAYTAGSGTPQRRPPKGAEASPLARQ